MSLRLLGLTLIWIVASLGTSAQERDRAANKPTTGRLSGRVIGSDTGRPVVRAQVSLMRGSETKPFLFAVTNESGIFTFGDLPDGRYVVGAEKRGIYLEAQYGRSAPDMPPKLVTVSAGSETDIDLVLPRAAAISGRIFDATGEPLPYATVTLARPPGSSAPSSILDATGPAMTITTTGGLTRMTLGSGAMTNDRGEFRLFGVAPGEYMLYGSAQRLQGDTRRYAPVYYPGVLDAASAERIQILPGQDLANVNFTLRLMPTITVSGVAIMPEGDPVRGGSLALYVPGAGALSQVGAVKTDGSFSFAALPGEYVLRVRYSTVASASESGYRGSFSVAQPIVIGTEDLSGLVVKLTRGATLNGRMMFEGSTPPQDVSRFAVSAHSGGPGEVVVARADENGAFTLRGIESGPKRLYAVAPAGWMLKGIFIGNRDVADVPIEFVDDTTISGVSVVFTPLVTRIQIGIRYREGEGSSVVVLFPDDSSLATERRIAVRSASKEPLTVEGLPPGDYLAVAISDAAFMSLNRPDERLLGKLRPLARAVQLGDGDAVSITLDAVPLPR